MSIIGSNILAGASGQAAGGGYAISRSLRFNSSDSASLSQSVSGSTTTYTASMWLKRSAVGNGQYQHFFFSKGGDGCGLGFDPADKLTVYNSNHNLTDAVYRDPSAWYHILLSVNSGTATLYVNGTVAKSGVTGFQWSDTATIGRYNISAAYYFNGYIADVYLVDGQALTPSSFTETDANGIIQPVAYSGSYGTRGFHLDFADNSTAAALGTDTSGNGNTWTVNNLSVTAGAGNDSLVDVPTNGAQTDTGVGGEVRGNYATLNPLNTKLGAGSLSNGNLDFVGPSGSGAYNYAGGTFGIDTSTSTGWYFEITQSTYGQFAAVALLDQAVSASSLDAGWIIGGTGANQTAGISYTNQGSLGNYGAGTTGLTSWTSNGDVIGVAIKDNKIWFAKNNTWISGSPSAGTSPSITLASTKYVTPAGVGINSSVFSYNFGQRAFAYTAPSGFKALNTANLPAPVVTKPSTVFDTKLYTGNGSTQTISGLGFSPDFVWLKARSSAFGHGLFDIVRGTGLRLSSDGTGSEQSESGVSAFNSDGFSVGSATFGNNSSTTMAAWCWDAGSSTVTNTQGSISSQVRANASAGFSIVTWTVGTAPYTVGHGLNAEPYMIITKSRTGSGTNWGTYHKSTGNQSRTYLNLTLAASSGESVWNNTTPTSTVFSLGSSGEFSGDMVAYCFAPVTGYSSFGSYVGNGSSDGVFQWCGFRPRWILLKSTGANGASWTMFDTARSTYNQTDAYLFANASSAEGNAFPIDILSNGFKLRTGDGLLNSSSFTYVWAAFAESPFQYARAR